MSLAWQDDSAEKVLADPDDLNPTPRAHMMERENLFPVLIF